MGQAIGQILGNAVGVAISPLPIAAVILMLLSPSAARNGLSFLVGWLVGLAGVAFVVLAVGVEASTAGQSDDGGVIKIVIGLAFLFLGWRQWHDRPRHGSPARRPSWMAAIDGLSATRAFGLGLLLTVPNPKNAGLTVAAAASIGGSGLDGRGEVAATIVFVLIASVTIITPVVASLVAGQRAAPTLRRTREWLTANNATVLTVVLVLIGAKVLGDGITILS